MNAYATFTPSPIPIPPPTIKSPSESPEFFLPKELLSPKKQKQDQYFQDYEIGESSHDSTLEQHGKKIEEILNHLHELPLDHIERIEDDVEGLALETQTATMAEADNSIREVPVAKRGNYKQFISYQHFYFNGMKGVVRLIRWFERTELVFSRRNCAEENKVAFATGTLTNDALSWWNAYSQPIGIEQANRITWTKLKRLLTNKYCPRTEIKKMEDEFYNLSVKGNNLKTYVRSFQELAVLCPTMIPNNEKLMKVFIGRLPRSIKGNVTASKPQTLGEAINIAQRLMDQVTKHNSIQGTNDHKRTFKDKRNISSNNNYRNSYQNIRNNRMNDFCQQQNRRPETFRSYAATPTENHTTYNIEMADGDLISTNIVIQGCTLTLLNQPFEINLMSIKFGSFNVIIGMDWLSKYHAKIICDEKVIHIPIEDETLIIRAQTEVLKEENVQAENLRGMEKDFKIRTDGTRCIKNRSWLPLFDHDSHFTSRFWQSLQNALGTQLEMSIAYHPETDGQSERTIQTLEDMLRACAIDFGKGWEKHLPLVEFSYNNSYHASIKAALTLWSKCRSLVCWAKVGDTQLTGP
nr:reverse transcriptase domain-containing protein [Tanacetum cinerariifolium]